MQRSLQATAPCEPARPVRIRIAASHPKTAPARKTVVLVRRRTIPPPGKNSRRPRPVQLHALARVMTVHVQRPTARIQAMNNAPPEKKRTRNTTPGENKRLRRNANAPLGHPTMCVGAKRLVIRPGMVRLDRMTGVERTKETRRVASARNHLSANPAETSESARTIAITEKTIDATIVVIRTSARGTGAVGIIDRAATNTKPGAEMSTKGGRSTWPHMIRGEPNWRE